MKIWIGHGSEHSYNLVMIGHFTDETRALSAEQKFQRLSAAAESELPEPGWEADQRFTSGMRALLDELKTWDLSRSDIENFVYEHTVTRNGKELRIETDEGEVQGFLKILIDGGARIEVYSAHDWTAEGKPQGGESEAQPQGRTEN
jgi:hypothetical protein